MIVFRLDANPTLGFGHLVRCRELARELRSRGHKVALYGAPREAMTKADHVIFSAWQDAEPWTDTESDVAALLRFGQAHGAQAYILDDFRVDGAYQLVLRQAGVRWLQFEGRAGQPIWADLLFCAHAGSDPEAFVPYVRNERCDLLVGASYALLRKEFRALPKRTASQTARRVFVSFGGGSDRGAAELVLRTLLPLFPNIAFCVISGAKNPNNDVLRKIAQEAASQVSLHLGTHNVAEIMRSCDFAIMAGGTMTLEAMAATLPMILIAIAENQVLPAEACSDKGAAIYIGQLSDLGSARLVAAFNDMLQPANRVGYIEAMRAFGVDGAGALRVADAIENMLAAEDLA